MVVAKGAIAAGPAKAVFGGDLIESVAFSGIVRIVTAMCEGVVSLLATEEAEWIADVVGQTSHQPPHFGGANMNLLGLHRP
jgi:hypothetical protein